MAASETQKQTIELGEALVSELTKDGHSTTLSRWMAYYIAEQMEEAKKSKGAKRKQAQARCSSAILKVWEHRASVPTGLHPFGGFEPILRVLGGIDSKRGGGFYAGSQADSGKSKDEKSADVEAFMEFVAGTDRAARIVIEFGLELAVESAQTPRTKTYLKTLHQKAETGDGLSFAQLMERLERLKTPDPEKEDTESREIWAGRLDSLERFIKAAEMVRGVISKRVNASVMREKKPSGAG